MPRRLAPVMLVTAVSMVTDGDVERERERERERVSNGTCGRGNLTLKRLLHAPCDRPAVETSEWWTFLRPLLPRGILESATRDLCFHGFLKMKRLFGVQQNQNYTKCCYKQNCAQPVPYVAPMAPGPPQAHSERSTARLLGINSNHDLDNYSSIAVLC
jgi:hypothetical protein